MSARKSDKQRRGEIKQKRLARAARLQAELSAPDVRWAAAAEGRAGIEPADRALLARHNNTVGALPEVYLDAPFVCRDCGETQVWTAKQQKWWYEVALGSIDSRAVRCLPCRRARRVANDRPGAGLLGELCARVRALGDSPPDAAAWREIEDALTNKWWGVRTTAIATLGRWGGPEAVERLKAYVETPKSGRWGGWENDARRAALQALGECLPAEDADWALQHVLQSGDAWALHRALAAQPPAFWEAAIAAEWRRGEPARLMHLCWLLRSAPADDIRRRQWQTHFGNHRDPAVRRAAGHIGMP